jgi:cytochrome c peroxidase
VAEAAPYMHAGQLATLEQVLQHYNQATPGPLGHNELLPLTLSPLELARLVAFLETLSGPLAIAPEWLGPPQ